MSRKEGSCLIIGCGGHACVVISILRESANSIYNIVGILDLNDPQEDENFLGVPVIGKIDELKQFIGSVSNVFLGLGDNTLRKKYFQLGVSLGFNFPNLISENAFIYSNVKLGKGNILCPHCHVGTCATMGDNNLLNTQSILEHESTLGNHCHIASGSVVCGRTHLEDEVFIGAGGVVIDKIHIVSHSIIGAGSVVTKNIEISSMVHVGIPAKPKKEIQ
jgi:sugar O-acyltransferase (sialic acid O-acetyltransferase NeuD family)